jgi:hypothetical protein
LFQREGCFQGFRLGLWALAVCGACSSAKPWDKALPQTSQTYALRRGLRTVRGPIHIHSPYSHDACDGKPLVNGVPDPTCLADLRRGLCTTHQDFAMLTDHADFVAQTDWDALFLPAAGDEVVTQGGQHIASKLACPDGTSVLLTVGSENDLMPLGLHEPVADTADARGTLLRGTDAATAQALRSHGALIAIAHGESHDYSQLVDVRPDVLEIYNVHANVGPDIRLSMGLDPGKPIIALFPYIQMTDPAVEPDMAMLAFWEENRDELGRLESMWSAGYHVAATLGVDAHENVISGHMSDDERGDAYRRLLRWFSNHLLVSELTPDGLVDALQRGRVYGLFEIFGSPVNFDYRAEAGGTVSELGDTVAVGATLILEAPEADEVAPTDLSLRIFRIDGAGSTLVASRDGRASLRVTADAPGAYRAEVRIKPHGLKRFMGSSPEMADQEFVWIYTSPIYAK